jgi:hypothetical protein
MREISCSGCGKTVMVSDSWTFKTCPKCHDKYAKQSASRSEIRFLKKKLAEALKDVDLSNHPTLRTIEVFKVQVAYPIFGRIPFKEVLERYLEAVEKIRMKQRDIKSKNENRRRLEETKENKRIFIDAYPCYSEKCVEIRRMIINKGKNPDDTFIIDAHCSQCDSCARWRIYDRDYFEETDESDAFADANYKPIGAGDVWDKGESEKSHEEKAKQTQRELGFNEDYQRTVQDESTLDLDLDRKVFSNSDSSSRKNKQDKKDESEKTE